MKALVLSGGAGNRLSPIPRTSAEQWVSVADGPVLFRGSEFLADANAVGDGSKSRSQAACVFQENPPGPAHAVLTAPAVRYPAGPALGAPTRAGTLDDLELGHLRPESAHGDGHGPNCSGDRTRARDEFGHRPRHGFAAGLAETVARHRGHPADPRTACGRFGLSGERAVSEEPPDASAVARTPWLCGLHGTDLVRTMLSLESRRPTADVLGGRCGRPTRSADVAERAAGPAESTPLIRKELSR